MIELGKNSEYKLAEKRLLKILQEAEEFDADKDEWISLEELKEVVGVQNYRYVWIDVKGEFSRLFLILVQDVQ